MANFLLYSLNKYYKEMMTLEGKIFVLNGFVNGFKVDLQKREVSGREVMGVISTFRDISQEGRGLNLYDTGYGYSLKLNKVENEIVIIMSKEYCLTLSQAYEVFEAFLADIFTELFLKFPELLVELKILQTKLHLPKKSLRELVREKLGRHKNNRKYITALRKLSLHFKKYEVKNIYNLDFSIWFDLISELRHNIVHGRQSISDKLLDFIK